MFFFFFFFFEGMGQGGLDSGIVACIDKKYRSEDYCPLRARWAIMLFKDVLLRTQIYYKSIITLDCNVRAVPVH